MRRFHISLLILVASLVIFIPANAPAENDRSIRFATYNIAMGLQSEGALYERLQSKDDEDLKRVAAVIQQVRPDVILMNEFDSYELDSTLLFINNYLDVPQFENEAISYAHSLNGVVNTGRDSGMDLNNNGKLQEPQDAWGFGSFPGQYGMVVLSRYPLKLERSFRFFKWRDMPGALAPANPDGTPWYPQEVFNQLRLSSKNHWDIAVTIDGRIVRLLASHPTPPVFDGPEDRNGARNHDEIRLWADYIDPQRSTYIYDDTGTSGGLPEGARFVIAGDLNADPVDGDSSAGAILQLLHHPMVNTGCEPQSEGSEEASKTQGGRNLGHKGNPAADTADFNDVHTGNMRIDYALPSANLKIVGCGVFWPARNQPGHDLVTVSDHRLVWVDIQF
jgi:endonuclease/exonuclease/phosphatase family metal-dependent hydrolase